MEPLRRATPHAGLRPREDLAAPRLAELAALDDAGFRALFSGSPVKRIGRHRFVRNVLIAIGNSADRSLLPVAARLTGDEDPVVAEAASWACRQLDAGPPSEAPANTSSRTPPLRSRS